MGTNKKYWFLTELIMNFRTSRLRIVCWKLEDFGYVRSQCRLNERRGCTAKFFIKRVWKWLDEHTAVGLNSIFVQIESCRQRPGWKKSSQELQKMMSLNVDKIAILIVSVRHFGPLIKNCLLCACIKMQETQFEDFYRDKRLWVETLMEKSSQTLWRSMNLN